MRNTWCCWFCKVLFELCHALGGMPVSPWGRLTRENQIHTDVHTLKVWLRNFKWKFKRKANYSLHSDSEKSVSIELWNCIFTCAIIHIWQLYKLLVYLFNPVFEKKLSLLDFFIHFFVYVFITLYKCIGV